MQNNTVIIFYGIFSWLCENKGIIKNTKIKCKWWVNVDWLNQLPVGRMAWTNF